MQRSRSRKLARRAGRSHSAPAPQRFGKLLRHASIGAAVIAAIAAARAQQPDPNSTAIATLTAPVPAAADAASPAPAGAVSAGDAELQEVTVTATRRAENIQNVPITISAISSASLQNQDIQDFKDYALALPQVSFVNDEPGDEQIIMRGVTSGGAGSTTGDEQTVGVYLDEQPITTPNGPLDLHMYDIARVEVLPGPQGTLYGAESEAGTLRIITNKPDPSHFSAGYTAQLNTVYNGTLGGLMEGFVNLPITSNFAVRLVGWYERDSGFINNVHQTLTFNNGSTLDNSPYVAQHYNPITTDGARAEFKFNINDNWSINPTLITQKTRWDGVFAQEIWKDTAAGPPIPSALSVAQYSPELGEDAFVDAALTVLGKIGNFDLTYAAAYLTRDNNHYGEYVDYTLAYQQYESLWPKPPKMVAINHDGYQTYSNELRIASPTDYPVRFVAGLFQERQLTDDVLDEPIVGVDPAYQVGLGTPFVWNSTWWLTYLQRVDRDWAAYSEVNWDLTSHLTATVGFRRFRYENTLEGFNGFGINAFGVPPPAPLYPGGPPGPGGIEGQQTCFTTQPFQEAPCLNLNGLAEGWGSTPKFNLSYKFDPDRLVYATFSKGFRPGGVNQNVNVAAFGPDYLTNYEIGWKTAWIDRHLIFDGALYYETWKNFQFRYVGQYSLPLIANAGNAEIKGAEGELQWLVTRGLNLSAAVAYNDSYLTQNYCGVLAANGQPITTNPCIVPGEAPFAPIAPAGTKLPFTPLFKTDLTARYSLPLDNYTAFVEADQTYQSAVWPSLRTVDHIELGQEPAYGLTNFSFGLDKQTYQIELLVKNAFNRLASTNRSLENQATATLVVYNNIVVPRLVGLQFSQEF